MMNKYQAIILTIPFLLATFGLCTTLLKPLPRQPVTQAPAPRTSESTVECTNVQRLQNEARDAAQKEIDDIPMEQAKCHKLRETTLTGYEVESCTGLYLEQPEILVRIYEKRKAKHPAHFCGRWRAP